MLRCWLIAAPLLSALRVPFSAPALRRSSSVRMMDLATQPSTLGRDPRESQLTEEKLAQLAEASKEVNPASASTSAAVSPVLTLEDFEAALADSASRGRLTVFKFYAPWCRTCTSIKKNYDAMAGGVMPKTMRVRMQAASNFAEVADFHEIECGGAVKWLAGASHARAAAPEPGWLDGLGHALEGVERWPQV